MIIKMILLLLLGLGGGLAVGAGFVAFLTVLGIVPRLMQMTKTFQFIHSYELAVISGAVILAWTSLHDYRLYLPEIILLPIGLFSGMFIGMLAAALTEVINVLPILAKRVGMGERIIALLMAIVFGKVLGSLFHWLYYVHIN
ncbi:MULTISPECIES: stage V sporulation protein AB [Bacillus]|uniref:Stage V sporulation protein AB n=2 Tax=Bacillus TaxID=1386 RepID=A0A0M3R9I3_9BACI|nr:MULTISPECIES: stage V sporulation protein AB [Bacillus]ALC81476.1 stage V sporulation protein AB [Bacillus gobiensis]MBP1080518.1 stage V sporulation protein AB [Bacillus capparidis]MED1094375.1 stage V sporulation protein AB [Bacillus capparidis]